MEERSYVETVNKRDNEFVENNMENAMVEFLEKEFNKPDEPPTKKQLARNYENKMKQISRQRFANISSKRKR